MTRAEAIEHLELRIRGMDNRYVANYPRWTISDYVAVGILLATGASDDHGPTRPDAPVEHVARHD